MLLVRRSRAFARLDPIHSFGMVVGRSNGCSVAVRMAIDHPELVARLVLCWPATAGDPEIDKLERPPVGMLRGATLRGVGDDELTRISLPVTISPSDPPNQYHQTTTVDRLLSLVPGATSTRAFPESVHPDFAPHRSAFLEMLVSLLV